MPHICPGSPPLGLNIDRCIISSFETKQRVQQIQNATSSVISSSVGKVLMTLLLLKNFGNARIKRLDNPSRAE